MSFHTLAELTAIALAVGAFAYAWQAYPRVGDPFPMCLGILLFWSGALDLVHLALYHGLVVGRPDPAMQVWMGTRYVQAAALLATPWFLTQRLARGNACAVVGGISAGLVIAVLAGIFPAAYVRGSALAALKAINQFAVLGLLAGALVFLWRRRRLVRGPVLAAAAAGIAGLMAAEVLFSFYLGAVGLADMAGHVLKVAAYGALGAAVYLGLRRS